VIEFGKILLLAMIDYLMCGSIMEQSGFIDDNSEWWLGARFLLYEHNKQS
jgi:hypothetical protein